MSGPLHLHLGLQPIELKRLYFPHTLVEQKWGSFRDLKVARAESSFIFEEFTPKLLLPSVFILV